MAYPEYIELFDSGSGGLTANDDGTFARDVNLRWLVSDKEGYLDAEAWGLSQAPDYFGAHKRKKLNCRPLGNKWWEVEAQYENKAIQADSSDNNQPDNNGGSDPVANTVAFDTTGATEHVTSAIDMSNDTTGLAFGDKGEEVFVSDSSNYVKFDGAINVNGGSVQGVDVVVPQFQFTETWVMPAAWITDVYVNALYRLTGTMNAAQFRVFTQGECLFLGARCEMTRGATMASVTYQFSGRPSRTNFKVGDILIAKKRGWDYMWVRYGSQTDNGYAVQRPLSVHVNQVYELGDFSKLAIGGAKFPTLKPIAISVPKNWSWKPAA